MQVVQAVAVAGAGVCAGLINTVVGSGTLITFPVLLAIGYPPVTANVSNGLGLVPGSLFGAIGYRRELAGQGRRVRLLGVASAVGGLIGAVLLLNLPPDAFQAVVPVLIALALVLVVFQPTLAKRLAARRAAAASTATSKNGAAGTGSGGAVGEAGESVADASVGGSRNIAVNGRESNKNDSNSVGIGLWLGILGTGIYGGYFGAAQGVIALGLMGSVLPEPLQRINAVKNVLTTIANLASGIVFIFVAHVAWLAVVLIAGGSAVGGVLGARVGRRLPPAVLRGIIVVVGIAAMLKLLI